MTKETIYNNNGIISNKQSVNTPNNKPLQIEFAKYEIGKIKNIYLSISNQLHRYRHIYFYQHPELLYYYTRSNSQSQPN